jgi:hypothetical protein
VPKLLAERDRGQVSTIIVFKGDDGKLEGFGDKGRRAYAKFKRTIAEMPAGEMMRFSFKIPRSIKHHGFFFKKLSALFDRQERFAEMDHLRAWVTVGAGYADLLPGAGGQLVAVPQTIAFDEMCEADFVDLHQKITAFLWTEYAQSFLWPHLTHAQTYQTIDHWHREFERR